jgi:GNAT superfamily N-acetyltransferase
MRLIKADKKKLREIVDISKKAFDSDVFVSVAERSGPPFYDSVQWHEKMLDEGHLFQAEVDGKIVGGAVLFINESANELHIGRLFIDATLQGKGYGKKSMKCIERMYPSIKEFSLDTPIWNVRTNTFYKKLGYKEEKIESGLVLYRKIL